MQIEREGRVSFGDARIYITEEGIPRDWNAAKAWEHDYKKQVFKRVLQTLNRLGWTCTVPAVNPEDRKRYGFGIADESARRHRLCHKGDLKGELEISGRCIKFEMFQNVNAPDRPDHDGRYQSDKEFHMPYLMRLEMERTRRRIRDYLCNVFTDYRFEQKNSGRGSKCGVNGLTALEFVQACYDDSCHFKGDLTKYEISDYNNKSADKLRVTHGARVWTTDYRGRIITGTAMYNINNMWWVVCGKYAVFNKASSEIWVKNPGELRRKRNELTRRKRLEAELARATKQMNFRRAEVLRDILWPKDEALYLLWHKEHKAYHRSGFSGYSSNTVDAGRFTRSELNGWVKGGAMEDDRHRLVPIEVAA
ncbi:hypothetical protein ABLG14_002306 [Pseudomonas aeruginosa]